MPNPAQSKLKVIKIMDPLLCVRCDCAYIADVVLHDSNEKKKMFYCSRLDCDNWISESANHSQEQCHDMDDDIDLAA